MNNHSWPHPSKSETTRNNKLSRMCAANSNHEIIKPNILVHLSIQIVNTTPLTEIMKPVLTYITLSNIDWKLLLNMVKTLTAFNVSYIHSFPPLFIGIWFNNDFQLNEEVIWKTLDKLLSVNLIKKSIYNFLILYAV